MPFPTPIPNPSTPKIQICFPVLVSYAFGHSPFQATRSLFKISHSPKFHAEYVELLPLLAQRLVPKRGARAADSPLEPVVEP